MHFKTLLSIIIPKPNKIAYSSLKMFCPIVLLNMLGNFIKKVTGNIIQFQAISSNFVHSNQLEGLKQHSTTNVRVFLIYFIYSGWVK